MTPDIEVSSGRMNAEPKNGECGLVYIIRSGDVFQYVVGTKPRTPIRFAGSWEEYCKRTGLPCVRLVTGDDNWVEAPEPVLEEEEV